MAADPEDPTTEDEGDINATRSLGHVGGLAASTGILNSTGDGAHLLADLAAANVTPQTLELDVEGLVLHNGLAKNSSGWTAAKDGEPLHTGTSWPPAPAAQQAAPVDPDDPARVADTTRIGITDDVLVSHVAEAPVSAAALARRLHVEPDRLGWALDRLVAAGGLIRRPNPSPGYGEAAYVYVTRSRDERTHHDALGRTTRGSDPQLATTGGRS